MEKTNLVRNSHLTVRRKLGRCLYGGKYSKVRRLGEKMYTHMYACVCVRVIIYPIICYFVKLFYKLYYTCIYKIIKNKYVKHTKRRVHVHAYIHSFLPNRLTLAIIYTFFQTFIRRNTTKRYRLGQALCGRGKLGFFKYSPKPNHQFPENIQRSLGLIR